MEKEVKVILHTFPYFEFLDIRKILIVYKYDLCVHYNPMCSVPNRNAESFHPGHTPMVSNRFFFLPDFG